MPGASLEGGERLGRYELLKWLASGGMAEVYLAKATGAEGVEKKVVVKRILPTIVENPKLITMFVDEARISVGLAHPNIAQVFEFGEDGGEYFMAMEYVRGQALRKIMQRVGEKGWVVPLPIALHFAMEMCKGLHHAHGRLGDGGQPLGIVHRDVSPENVIVSYSGEVKVVDFGIARAASSSTKTAPGTVKGKYIYFSPEQALSKDVDLRTDVYAVGVTLYEMVTGWRPYRGDFYAVLQHIVKGEFPPPTERQPEVGPALERIILRAMALRASERYQSCLDLQDDLAAHLAGIAPRFTPAEVTRYMEHLFRDELLAEGLDVEFDRDFQDRMAMWRRAEHGSFPPAHLVPADDDEVTASIVERGVPTMASRPSAIEKETTARTNKLKLVAMGALMGVAVMGVGLFAYEMGQRVEQEPEQLPLRGAITPLPPESRPPPPPPPEPRVEPEEVPPVRLEIPEEFTKTWGYDRLAVAPRDAVQDINTLTPWAGGSTTFPAPYTYQAKVTGALKSKTAPVTLRTIFYYAVLKDGRVRVGVAGGRHGSGFKVPRGTSWLEVGLLKPVSLYGDARDPLTELVLTLRGSGSVYEVGRSLGSEYDEANGASPRYASSTAFLDPDRRYRVRVTFDGVPKKKHGRRVLWLGSPGTDWRIAPERAPKVFDGLSGVIAPGASTVVEGLSMIRFAIPDHQHKKKVKGDVSIRFVALPEKR